MNIIEKYGMAFVADEGSYNQSAGILVFPLQELTDNQWETLEKLHDSDKFEYARAVLNDDLDLIAEFESDFL